MFEEIKNDQVAPPVNTRPFSAPLQSAPVKTEDIFAEVDSSSAIQGKALDKTAKPEVFKTRPDGSAPPRGAVIPPEMNWRNNKKIVFGLLFGGLAVIAAGAYFGVKLAGMVKTGAGGALVQEQPVKTEAETTAAEPAAPVKETVLPPAQVAPLDSDLDGLTDEEEAALGANPNTADTDQDGLTDREEVKVYGTDPLIPDTDGDGYKDGAEVSNGYNPKGAGKLLEIK